MGYPHKVEQRVQPYHSNRSPDLSCNGQSLLLTRNQLDLSASFAEHLRKILLLD